MAASVRNIFNNNNTSRNSPYVTANSYQMAGKFRGPKRSRELSNGPPKKKPALHVGFALSFQALARAAESVTVGGKSPVSALNELGVKVMYSLMDYRGPAHCPSFTVDVTVANMTFRGHGASKREARANAARICLNSLLAKAGQVLPVPVQHDLDFTSDQPVINPNIQFQLPTVVPPPVPFPVPKMHQATNGSEVYQAINVPKMHQATNGSVVHQATAVPKMHQATTVPKMHHATNVPEMNRATNVPEMNQATNVPEMNQAKNVPEMNQATNVPAMHQATNVPEMNQATNVPEMDQATNVPEMDQATNVPEVHQETIVPNGSSGPITKPDPLFSESASPFTPSALSHAHKSPINMLYENYPGVSFLTTFGDGTPLESESGNLQINHSMRFKVVCTVKDQTFEGYGSSKKHAKLAASRSALAALTEISTQPAEVPVGNWSTLPQQIADHVAKLVNEKFNELMKNDPVHSKRKVLAGIVMTVDNHLEKSKIIAVSTGTKCVSGEYMSVSGRAVNDCHAEVAARRCLQRYLYRQLLMYAQSKNPRLPIAESDLQPLAEGGYKLKDDRRIHLYVSTAPCGDGRIFSPHESKGEPDRHPNRFSRGQLRSKIESGEGTIPVKNSNYTQTWDGVLQGERLLTMSCSDKVARWCVTGLQGALMSQILKPVYLTSLVLGSLLHTEHMYRAICGRIESYIQAIPPPFRLVAPMLARAASTEMPEILNAVTGKLENEQPSLLCKQAMFARWIHLVKKLPTLPQTVESDIKLPTLDEPESLLYAEAKQLSTGYQEAKHRLKSAFEKAQLGKWVKKPIEQDQFLCEIHDANPTVLFA